MTINDTATWQKATRSGGDGNCVEVKYENGAVLIRDSKYRRNVANDPADEPIITVSTAQWLDFLAAVAGDVATSVEPTISQLPHGSTILRNTDGVTLIYTRAEWEAFAHAVHSGEFDDLVLERREAATAV